MKLDSELRYEASRSSGKGGQNVNKVSTKVTLKFNVFESEILSEQQKSLISEKLSNRINSSGFLQVSSQTERSQYMNRKRAAEIFYSLIKEALRRKKARKKTKPTAASEEKRLKSKKIKSEIKKQRKNFIEPI